MITLESYTNTVVCDDHYGSVSVDCVECDVCVAALYSPSADPEKLRISHHHTACQ